MVGTAGLPHVIVRFFTVPKVKDARSSAGWALVFIALLYTTAPAVSVMARYNLINTVHPEITDTEITSLAYDERPEWMKRWEQTKLINGMILIMIIKFKASMIKIKTLLMV